MLELLFVSSLLAIVAAMAIPPLSAGVERARARAAARYLATRMAIARTHAVTRSATVALRFQRGPGGLVIAVHADGNGNGVRTRDIDNGIDRLLERPVRLQDLFPGVTIAVPPTFTGSAVELGGSELLSFTASGTASSGTISVLGRDGSLFGVRVLGVTGRIRLMTFDPATRDWTDSF